MSGISDFKVCLSIIPLCQDEMSVGIDDFDVVTVHDSAKLQYFYDLILNYSLEGFILIMNA